MNKVLFVTRNVTDYAATDLEGVGTLRWEGGKLYRWIQNAESANAWTVGGAVGHVLTNATTFLTTGIVPATANLSVAAGLAVSAVPATYYGWVLVLGAYTTCLAVNTTDVAIVIGDNLKMVNAVTYFARDTAYTAAATYRKHFRALSGVTTHTTPTTNNAVVAYVDCV